MRRISGAGGGKETPPPRHRGQSDVVVMVLLIGAVIAGALFTIAIGGMALQSVQDSTEGRLAQDTAQQAHTALSEAATTGEAREIPVGDGAVDAEVIEGGTLTISMHDGAATCSETIHEDMGALRYTGGDRTMIYEGGAIWTQSEGGLSVERTPPISHGPDGTRISVLSVSAAATTSSGRLVAEPNESARLEVAQQTEQLLTACPANGYTDLRINVTSPYHQGWDRHFEEHVATTGNVTITRPTDQSVVATIENATDPRSTDGIGINEVDAPTGIAPGDDLTIEAAVANDDFDPANTTVRLEFDGTSIDRTRDVNVSAFGVERTAFSIDSGTINTSFAEGSTNNYTVSLENESGATVSSLDGSFTFGTTAPLVRLESVDHTLSSGDDNLTVTATLRNHGLANGTGAVTLNLTDSDLDINGSDGGASRRTVSPVNVSGGGTSSVAFPLDVSGLPRDHYDYAVEGPGRIADAFTIDDRPGTGAMAGDLRIADLNASATRLAAGDDFGTELTLDNVANSTTTGNLTVDVAGLSPTTSPVSLDPGASVSVREVIDASTLAGLESGRTHEYTITVTSDGETASFAGSFYLGERGADLGVESVTAVQDNGTVTVTATVDNDGLANGTDTATLSGLGPDGSSVEFGSTPGRNVSTPRGATSTVTFEFDGSSLGGEHTFTVEYGDESGSDSVALDAIESDGGGVAIGAAGEGTVRVLGTEVSAEGTTRSGDWLKRWAPIGVSVVENRSGTEQSHRFENGETSMDLPNEHNLNTYDTQHEEWVWDWEQDAGETMRLTLNSTIWNYDFNEDDCGYPVREEDHDRTGPGYGEEREWTDQHPMAEFYENGDCMDPLSVDASSDDYPSNVRVLTDGDEVPDLTRGYPDQRTAAEVLNQGAATRIDPDSGELTLGPNEAVFLFEMTRPDADWERATETAGDPDYNDVIAIVEFEPDSDDVSVEMNATDGGSGLVIETPGVSGSGGGEVSVGDVDTTEGDGAGPGTTPEAPGTGVGSPTPPEDVEVEVDVVQVG